ncbi:hypothetical protein EVAR_80846_1 [Eumeta japonica]|uniref:Uncharacterized protein n=1 Tax=Eumeta variegata TaxID=151549 RepID=A0A4C1V0P9_EUMVA|nr:hypothetical protein EVAR_80846_1 [Eumeta japonica]
MMNNKKNSTSCSRRIGVSSTVETALGFLSCCATLEVAADYAQLRFGTVQTPCRVHVKRPAGTPVAGAVRDRLGPMGFRAYSGGPALRAKGRSPANENISTRSVATELTALYRFDWKSTSRVDFHLYRLEQCLSMRFPRRCATATQRLTAPPTVDSASTCMMSTRMLYRRSTRVVAISRCTARKAWTVLAGDVSINSVRFPGGFIGLLVGLLLPSRYVLLEVWPRSDEYSWEEPLIQFRPADPGSWHPWVQRLNEFLRLNIIFIYCNVLYATALAMHHDLLPAYESAVPEVPSRGPCSTRRPDQRAEHSRSMACQGNLKRRNITQKVKDLAHRVSRSKWKRTDHNARRTDGTEPGKKGCRVVITSRTPPVGRPAGGLAPGGPGRRRWGHSLITRGDFSDCPPLLT